MKSPRTGPRRLEETKRIGRVLRILRLIDAQPRQWTRAGLADELEVSERAIDNDLQLIRHSLRYELCRTRTGYCFTEGPITNPVNLSLPELLALALAAQAARDTGSVDPVTVASALTNLEVALPPQLLPYLRRVAAEQAAAVVRPAVPRGPTLATLEQAMAEGRAVDKAYRSASRGDALSERRIHPYRLVPYDNSWQIIAHDGLRQTVRMFKVDRIERCVLTGERYEMPAHFDVDAYLGDTCGVLRGEGGQAEGISLVFTPTAAAWVRDERRHPSQTAEPLPDGGIRLRFHATVTHELVRWVLSFGGDVTVEQPEALRKEVVEAAAAVLRVANAPGHPIS
jgi:predicted DNA-binding transcriptional regulator YafY